jgi:hypothetical protein
MKANDEKKVTALYYRFFIKKLLMLNAYFTFNPFNPACHLRDDIQNEKIHRKYMKHSIKNRRRKNTTTNFPERTNENIKKQTYYRVI